MDINGQFFRNGIEISHVLYKDTVPPQQKMQLFSAVPVAVNQLALIPVLLPPL